MIDIYIHISYIYIYIIYDISTMELFLHQATFKTWSGPEDKEIEAPTRLGVSIASTTCGDHGLVNIKHWEINIII